MTRRQLLLAIANVTGEDSREIRRRGFSLVDARPPISAEDFDQLIDDWDQIEAEELIERYQERRRQAVSVGNSQNRKSASVRSTNRNRVARGRRGLHAAS